MCSFNDKGKIYNHSSEYYADDNDGAILTMMMEMILYAKHCTRLIMKCVAILVRMLSCLL